MGTPAGYGLCSYELRHASMSRSAFLTFGVNATETDPATVALAVRTAFTLAGSLYSCIDTSVNLIGVRVSLGTDGGEDLVAVNTTVSACNRTLASPPPNCATLVHKRTARGGRRGRGRMYIPWAITATSLSENGALPGGDVSTVQAAVDVWRGALNTGGNPLVLLHRPSLPGTEHPTVPGAPDPVISCTVDPLVATQRRRLGR